MKGVAQLFQHTQANTMVRPAAMGEGHRAVKNEVPPIRLPIRAGIVPKPPPRGRSGIRLPPRCAIHEDRRSQTERNLLGQAARRAVRKWNLETFPKLIHPRLAPGTRFRSPAVAMASRHWRR